MVQNIVKIYLAHRDNIQFFEQQVTLIRKYFQCNDNSTIQICGFVDSQNNSEIMKKKWEELDVLPINIPQVINNQNRCTISASESFGLAFQYVYENYILKDDYISVFIENDVFPFKYMNIEDYVADHEICGDIRFNATNLPVRITHFWLGFIIFNNRQMQDRTQFSGLCTHVQHNDSKYAYWTDCGGTSYYWIQSGQRRIRQMVTNGNETYDGFNSATCTPHNITTDIEHLPTIFQEGYQSNYRVLVYDNCLIHLEQMGKKEQPGKYDWWCKCYNKLVQSHYIPIGFQCTNAQILKTMNKRECSYPFDWILSNPNAVYNIFKLLFIDNMDIPNIVKTEFFNTTQTAKFIRPDKFTVGNCDASNVLYNSKYNLIFPHDQHNSETIEKYIRRFERLKQHVLSGSKCVFIFINRIAIGNIDGINYTINEVEQLDNLYQRIVKLYKLLTQVIHKQNCEIIFINSVLNYTVLNNNIDGIEVIEIVPKNGTTLTDEEIINRI